MTAITFTGANPTVGGSTDTWGTTLNTGRTQIKADLDMLNAAPTTTILGRVTAGTGEVERLTGAQAATIIPAVVGDAGSGGVKGLVPAPAAGDAAAEKYLNADGTWGVPRPFAFALIDGSTGAIVQGVNVASVSKALGVYDVTMTIAASSANYTVQATPRIAAASGTATASVDNTSAPTTTTFRVRTHILTTAPAIGVGDVDFLYVAVWQ